MSEQPSSLHLNPSIGERLKRYLLSKDPGDILAVEFSDRIRPQLHRLLLSETFSQDIVIASIAATARDQVQQAFQKLIHEEVKRRQEGERDTLLPRDPLLRHLESEVGNEIQPESVRLVVPDSFFESLEVALKNEKPLFDFVERVREHPAMKEFILPLLRQLLTLDSDGWHL